MPEPLIQLENVHKKFGNQVILDGVDLSIFGGEVLTVIGKSGGGKSVLLKHVIGLITPDSGRIVYEGRSIDEMTIAERRALKSRFSYMFQGTALFDSMPVYDNIALPLKERATLSGSAIRGKVSEKMSQLDLNDIEDKYPSQISGGMKKRVALARALVTDPEIVLFDEPTTGLDPIRKNAVHSMICDYQRKFGFTAVVVSHEIPDVFYISQRIAMLDKGRIHFQGTPDEIKNSDDAVVNEFVKGLEAEQDDLTGLDTHIHGEQKFTVEMKQLRRNGTAFSLVLFKVDNMEEINTKWGHVEGQRILKNFAAHITGSLRHNDTCSRMGLNRIMLLMPGTKIDGARHVCARMTGNLKSADVFGDRLRAGFCFSVSAGFAQAHPDSNMEEMLERAKSDQNKFYDFRIC